MSGNANVGQASGSISPARVIMVPGPTQLLNVISVLHYQRDQEELNGFTDILLIGGLSHLKAPKAPLYAACVDIAKAWSFFQMR
jgi:hypothetical protein